MSINHNIIDKGSGFLDKWRQHS